MNNKEQENLIQEYIKKKEMEEELKLVIEKKHINIITPYKLQLKSFVLKEIKENNYGPKNLKVLLYYLLNIKIFKDVVDNYNLSEDLLETVFSFCKYVQIEKGNYIYRQQYKSDFCYLLISGKIAYISQNDECSTNIVDESEPGEFIGITELIWHIKRMNSCYAKEDSILLSINLDIFNKYFQKNLFSIETHWKGFILEHVKSFKSLNQTIFDQFYRNAKKIYCNERYSIIKKGEKSVYFYLIIKGYCIINSFERKLIIKNSGDLIGTECFNQKEYENTILSGNNNTVLIRFNKNDFTGSLYYSLNNEFKKLSKGQKNILIDKEKNYNIIKDTLNTNYINIYNRQIDLKLFNKRAELRQKEKYLNKVNPKTSFLREDELFETQDDKDMYCHLFNFIENKDKNNSHKILSSKLLNFQKTLTNREKIDDFNKRNLFEKKKLEKYQIKLKKKLLIDKIFNKYNKNLYIKNNSTENKLEKKEDLNKSIKKPIKPKISKSVKPSLNIIKKNKDKSIKLKNYLYNNIFPARTVYNEKSFFNIKNKGPIIKINRSEKTIEQKIDINIKNWKNNLTNAFTRNKFFYIPKKVLESNPSSINENSKFIFPQETFSINPFHTYAENSLDFYGYNNISNNNSYSELPLMSIRKLNRIDYKS